MGFRSLCTPRCALITVSLAAFVLFVALLVRLGQRSSDAAPVNTTYAEAVLSSLCTASQEKFISGDLCNRLCYHQNLTLAEFYSENKIVAILLMGGQKVVLKSQREYYHQFDQLPSDLPDDEYLDKLLLMVNFHLQIDWPRNRINHLLELLWPPYSRNTRLSANDKRSLWTLANQEEYLTFAVFQLAGIFPKITGTCGHFYAVEQLVPFKLDSVLYSNVKAKVLVHLMGTLRQLTDFFNEPLHWCDVKFENLGLSANYPKRFMIMDADMLFTESRMQSLFNSTPCTDDADCTFFDCASSCNQTSGYCANRSNDNIEVFCRKLVLQLFGPFWSKANRFLAACHMPEKVTPLQRLKELRSAWAFSLTDF